MAGNNTVEVSAEVRRYQVIQLKVAGATERAIAEQLGVSHSLVHKDVRRALSELADTASGAADELRALQMERYNQLLLSWWQVAKSNPEGIRWVLQIMGRIDAINGLIPNRPMINMVSATQNTMVVNGVENVKEMLHDADFRAALELVAERMESIPGVNGSEVVVGPVEPPAPPEYHIVAG
jgi:hypothetical protein